LQPPRCHLVFRGSDSTRAITSLSPARSAATTSPAGQSEKIQPVPVSTRRLHQAAAGQQRAHLDHSVTSFLPEGSAKLF
jgi:hypothetical protein